jgi:hypothetical protein
MQHLALVSLSREVSNRQLMIAAAAIQKQITRDFAPIWEITADVAAFECLSDVPLGYWPIIIADADVIKKDNFPNGTQGIHLNQQNGQPFAIVEASENWTLITSHECLEMLTDPSGNRIQAGTLLKDGRPEGRVGYLVEVCDPCEASQYAYSVNGVLVSDFYTPNFFDPRYVKGVRYSFTGAITEPHQVLEGGYLSWFDAQSLRLYQKSVLNGKLTIESHPLPENVVNLRRFSDKHSTEHRIKAMTGELPKQLLLAETVKLAKHYTGPGKLEAVHRANAEPVAFKLVGDPPPSGLMFKLFGNPAP